MQDVRIAILVNEVGARSVGMYNDGNGSNFLLGNVILGLALFMLLVMGSLWERFGVWAMIVWVVLVGLGTYFLMSGKSEPPSSPG